MQATAAQKLQKMEVPGSRFGDATCCYILLAIPTFLAGPTLHSGEHGAGKLSAGGPGQVLLAAKLLSEISPLVAARS